MPLPGAANAEHPHPFDLTHGTDTGGYLPGADLSTGSPADLYNSAYYAISPSTLTAALGHIPAPLETLCFYDLGCGKGRALLVAAAFPFQQIKGVELSPPLAAIARQNTTGNPRIQVTTGDAATCQYPQGPLLVFLYHPFLAPLLKKALRNLLRQREAQPHPTFVLYANCTYSKVMAIFPTLKPLWTQTFPLSEKDARAHQFGADLEQYGLWQLRPRHSSRSRYGIYFPLWKSSPSTSSRKKTAAMSQKLSVKAS